MYKKEALPEIPGSADLWNILNYGIVGGDAHIAPAETGNIIFPGIGEFRKGADSPGGG